jgi:cbb3-type cytochrome oxidase maturation protein
MSALVVLIAASLILASGFLFAFIRATKKGQYEDVYTPSVRILFEDSQQPIAKSQKIESNSILTTSLTNKTTLSLPKELNSTNKEENFEPSVPFKKNDQSQTTQ